MRRARAGFTLLELLIAIALFALLGLATYRMLEAVLRSDEVVRVQEAQLRELGRALWSLERDLHQAVPRPIRDGYGDERNAFIGQLASTEESVSFELTRSGWRNPTGLPRANLQRVRWRLAGDNLERLYWVVLDRDIESQPRVQRVLEGVSEWRLRYLDSEKVWHEEWPPFAFGRSDPEQQARSLPAAVEVSFEHPRFGNISRLLRLPENAAPPAFFQPTEPEDGSIGAGQGEPPAPQEPQP
jgi:general secretion pathway protein J